MAESERSAAIYCRISQDRTGKEAGVQRQEEDCRKLAAECGWTVAEVYVDNDTSAYGTKPRPGYLAMLDAIQRGDVTAVLAWHPDRLYRKARELVDFVDIVQAHETAIATVRAGRVDLTSASGRLHASMLGSVAVYESEIKSERITRAAEQRAQAGRWSGGMRPYGYEGDGVTVRESEAMHVRGVVADLLAGVSLREATRRITDAGATTSTGKAWTTQHLRMMLLSPRIAGLASYRGAVVGRAEWPGLVIEEHWRAVKALLENPARTSTPGPTPRHLLSGIAVCGREDCGKPCRVSISGGAKRTRSRRYRCPHGHVIREKIALEEYVLEATFALLETNEVQTTAPSETNTAATEAEAVRRRLDTLAEDYADGVLTREQLAAATARSRERLDKLESEIRSTARAGVLQQLAGKSAREVWPTLPLVRQRAILAELWTVRLHPMPPGHRGVNERGVELVPRWIEGRPMKYEKRVYCGKCRRVELAKRPVGRPDALEWIDKRAHVEYARLDDGSPTRKVKFTCPCGAKPERRFDVLQEELSATSARRIYIT
jgi:DNA invertase Pin-like site-specific DNA recombinase